MLVSIFTGKMKIIYNISKMQYRALSLFGVLDYFFQGEQTLFSNSVGNSSVK